jgi:subtilisin family serine protease
MKILIEKFIFILISLLIGIQGYANNNNFWENKVSSLLFSQLQLRGKADFIVYLDHQIVLQDIKTDKLQKANMAFNDLVNNKNNQSEIVKILGKGNYKFRQFFIINAILVYEGDKKIVEELARRDEVARLTYDNPLENSIPKELELRSSPVGEYIPWGISMIEADKVWAMGYKGQGIVVGGQDTGYDWDHEALIKNYRGYEASGSALHDYNWHDAIHEIDSNNKDSIISPTNNPCGLDSKVPCDDRSHGTHTMGTMIGKTDSLSIGVAPEAKWIGCRNMERGWGKPSTYIECFEWFMAPTDLNGQNPDPSKAPDVINNSWGCPVSEGCDSSNWQYMELALNNLRASGVFVVVSAGNSGINNCGSINTPAAFFKNSFSVGATKMIKDTVKNIVYDTIASFSSRGPVIVDGSYRLKPDISAPGQSVFSSIPNNRYSYSSGTSMAGPHVVGVVALILSAYPELRGQNDKIDEILRITAEPRPEVDICRNILEKTTPNSIVGHGRINALAAIIKTLDIKTSVQNDIRSESSEFSVYPNPFIDKLKIFSENRNKSIDVTIFDRLGKTVFSIKQTTENEFDLQYLSTGTYFIRINDGSIVNVLKIIKI